LAQVAITLEKPNQIDVGSGSGSGVGTNSNDRAPKSKKVKTHANTIEIANSDSRERFATVSVGCEANDAIKRTDLGGAQVFVVSFTLKRRAREGLLNGRIGRIGTTGTTGTLDEREPESERRVVAIS